MADTSCVLNLLNLYYFVAYRYACIFSCRNYFQKDIFCSQFKYFVGRVVPRRCSFHCGGRGQHPGVGRGGSAGAQAAAPTCLLQITSFYLQFTLTLTFYYHYIGGVPWFPWTTFRAGSSCYSPAAAALEGESHMVDGAPMGAMSGLLFRKYFSILARMCLP